MKICVIGAGISGLAAAHYLSDDPRHAITVLEASAVFGGRANVTAEGEHCTRLFLPDYHYLLELLSEIPVEGALTVCDSLQASDRFARTRRGQWLQIDHIYAFLSATPGLSLRDKWSISKANRESLLVAKKAQRQAHRALGRDRRDHDIEVARGTGTEDSLNLFAPIWNWSPRALMRAVRSARGSGTTYALPGATDRYLIEPWTRFLRSRGVVLRGCSHVETLGLEDDGVQVRTATANERFDVVLVTAFASDAYALLDRSGVPRPLDHRGHTHCKCFTIDLDPREAIVRRDAATRIYSHGGMTTVVQPRESRCVTLATFTASTERTKIVTELTRQLGLVHAPLRVRCRTNLEPGEAVFVGDYVDPVELAGPLAPYVYFAGSYTANSYAVDSGEGASRSAYYAVSRIATDHSVRVRSDEHLPVSPLPGRPSGETCGRRQRSHPNEHPHPARASRLWRLVCTASAIVARGVAELTFLDHGETSWPLDEPAVYVANHRSVFDVPAGLLTFRHLKVFPRLVVARKYFNGPAVGGLRAVGAFPALRGSDATVTAAATAIEHGESVAFMVEGRITTRAQAPLAAHGRGAAATATRTGAPIVPIGAWGTDRVWPTSRPWPLLRRRRPPVVIAIGQPIRPDGLSVDELKCRVRAALEALEQLAAERAGGLEPSGLDLSAPAQGASPRGPSS